MFRNNIKTACRNLFRNKLQTGINIAGLAIGIAGCLTVFLLANYELSFNKEIIDADRIYRVYTETTGEFASVNPGVPTGVKSLAGTAVHGTDVQCMLHAYRAKVTVSGEPGSVHLKKLEAQKDLIITGPEYFDLIQNYEWIVGSPRQSMSSPFQVVLTESKTKKYFGVKDVREAVGREVIYSDSLRMVVSGVLKDPDFRSDFCFNDFLSSQTIPGSFLKNEISLDEWDGYRSADQFFVKASEGVTKEVLAESLTVLKKRTSDDGEILIDETDYNPQPLSDLHFNQQLGTFDNGLAAAHKPTLFGLMLIAILLLLIAAINFINLATVQASRRSKETGVRKVIGASRRQLTGQYLVETLVITILAIPVSMALTEFAMRYFSEFMPDGLSLNIWSSEVLFFLSGSVIAVTFLAGLYPSFVMSSFHPAFALKAATGNALGRQSSGLRKSLIVFQFVLAQAFIIGSFIMGKQMNFVLQKDLGFDQDAIVYLYTYGRGQTSKRQVFQQRLEQLPEVKGTALQNKPPIDNGYQTSILTFERDKEQVKSEVHFRMVDTSYIGLYNIELLAGRNLFQSDTIREYVINETLSREMGYSSPADAVGNLVGRNNVPIVGVVKDFHVRSFHHTIPPAILTNNESSAYAVAVKISQEKPFAANLEKIKSVWQEMYPNADFHYLVLNETVAKMYETEAQLSKLINTATGLAILVSCLGLFGLAFFTVTQRAKEISIRKVLGASVTSVVGLLSKDFLILVIVALVVASPIAYYFMEQWLQDFAYRIDIQWWVFALAGLAAVGVAFLTVSFQSVKAALANPVESLRSE